MEEGTATCLSARETAERCFINPAPLGFFSPGLDSTCNPCIGNGNSQASGRFNSPNIYFQLLCSYFDSSVTLNGLQLRSQKLLTALLTSVFACSDFLQVWIKIAVWGKFQ